MIELEIRVVPRANTTASDDFLNNDDASAFEISVLLKIFEEEEENETALIANLIDEQNDDDDSNHGKNYHHRRQSSFLSSISTIVEDDHLLQKKNLDLEEKIEHLEHKIEDFSLDDFVGISREKLIKAKSNKHSSSVETWSAGEGDDGSSIVGDNNDDNNMYEKNTDLNGIEEEVDPRVEFALEDLNEAAENVNKMEQEYGIAKLALKNGKEEARVTLEEMYSKLSGAVKKAVPALHKRALASLYQNRSQEAMMAHAECFDHHEKCKRNVSKLEAMLEKKKIERKKRRRKKNDDDDDDDDELVNVRTTAGEKEQEEKNMIDNDDDDVVDDDNDDGVDVSLLHKLSEAVANVAEAERVMRRALFAHETNARCAIDAVTECNSISKKTNNKAIKKAQNYFACKKEGEDKVDILELAVKNSREFVKLAKLRYRDCLNALNLISNEVHERRELERKARDLASKHNTTHLVNGRKNLDEEEDLAVAAAFSNKIE
jgi:SH3-domain binding protein 5